MSDSAEAIARDIAAVARISAVPSLLRLICQNTGMGYAAVARVTVAIGSWILRKKLATSISDGQIRLHGAS